MIQRKNNYNTYLMEKKIITIIFFTISLILVGCGNTNNNEPETTTNNIPKAITTPKPKSISVTANQTEKKIKPTQIGVYEGTMKNPVLGKTQPLHLELKDAYAFTAYPDHEPNNKLHGNWKIDGDFLVCSGKTELTKQTMTLKIDSTSMELISINQGIKGRETEMFLSQLIPTGAKSIIFRKKSTP